MAGARECLTLVAAALLLACAVVGAERRPLLLGAPTEIDNPENDEGLQRALQFAMAEYNKASNDMYYSRVVRIISAQRQCQVPFLWRLPYTSPFCTFGVCFPLACIWNHIHNES